MKTAILRAPAKREAQSFATKEVRTLFLRSAMGYYTKDNLKGRFAAG